MRTVTEIIKLNDRNRWIAGIAGAALAAGIQESNVSRAALPGGRSPSSAASICSAL